MKKWFKITLGLIISGIIIFLIAGYFFYRMLFNSLPDYEGTITSGKIANDIEIYRDKFAVPYIYAKSDEDVAFALGYVHAQERMFTMDLIRRSCEGRLSEVLGEKAIPFDAMFRTVGIFRNLERNYTKVDDRVIKLLQAYSNGVNRYLKQYKGRYAIEFDVLGYTPEEWKPIHSLMVVRMIAWQLNMGWWTDINFSELIQKLGKDKVLEILPDYPENGTYIIDQKLISKKSGLTEFYETDKQFRNFIGWTGTHIGSNNWVVNGKKSKSGKPIIANDPHLAFSAPGIWYAAVLNGDNWKASGVTLPGVPGIAIGKNENISWVLTNIMNDEADFYYEKIDTTGKKYFVDNQWLDLKVFSDTIKVKNEKDTVIVIKENHRGPIISDIHPKNLIYNTEQRSNPPITMKWMGNDFSDEILAFLMINKANDWQQFKDAVSHFNVPGQNFVYGDKAGNIGYVFGGRIPIRKSINPTLIFDGTTKENDWQGYLPVSEIPVLFNPPQNYIATANNKTLANFKYHISNLWEPPSRIDRIKHLLESKDVHSSKDFKDYQMDITSPYAEKITSYIITAFENVKLTDKNLAESVELLSKWNFEMNKGSQIPSIYAVFFKYLLYNTYYDEMGYDLYNKFVFLANVPYRSILQILENPNSSWFDKIITSKIESRDDIIRESLSDAMTYLEKNYGKDIVNWQWGKLHKATFKHAFSGQFSLLDEYINIGPTEISGDGTTIFNTEYPFSEPDPEMPLLNYKEFDNVLGPSMRFVYDFADGNEFFLILTTGQSGNVFSDNYRDMNDLWFDGNYVKINTDPDKQKTNGKKLLRIVSGLDN